MGLLLNRLRTNDGFALVMAVGVVAVLSIAITSSIYYTSTNARSAGVSGKRVDAHALAEAALRERPRSEQSTFSEPGVPRRWT